MWYFRLGPDDNDESWLEVNGAGRCVISECVPVREPVSP